MRMPTKAVLTSVLYATTLWHGASGQSVSAPVPSQFATAKTAFLSFAGMPVYARDQNDAVRLAYPSIYQGLSKDGHYRLVASPSEAELSIQISIEERFSDVTGGSSTSTAGIALRFVDIKTGVVLWTLVQPVPLAFRKETMARNIEGTTARLMADMDALIAGKLP